MVEAWHNDVPLSVWRYQQQHGIEVGKAQYTRGDLSSHVSFASTTKVKPLYITYPPPIARQWNSRICKLGNISMTMLNQIYVYGETGWRSLGYREFTDMGTNAVNQAKTAHVSYSGTAFRNCRVIIWPVPGCKQNCNGVCTKEWYPYCRIRGDQTATLSYLFRLNSVSSSFCHNLGHSTDLK